MFRKALVALLILFAVAGLRAPAHAQDAACDEGVIRAGIQRINEKAFTQGNLTVVDEVFAETYISHPDEGNRDDFKASITALRNAMPDGQASGEHVLVEGCEAFFVFHFKGTLTNALQFPEQEPLGPTGQPFALQAHIYLRFNEQGQVVEEWDYVDNFSLLAQAGVIPMPPMEGETEAGMEPTEEAMPDMTEETVATSGYESLYAENVRQSYEEGNTNGNVELLRQLYAPDYLGHSVDGTTYTLDEFLANLAVLRSAFPDLAFTVNDTVAQGNQVAARVTLTGTFQNELALAGQDSIPPTGQPIVLEMSFVHVVNAAGQIVEDWELYDQLGLLIQLGVFEAPAE